MTTFHFKSGTFHWKASTEEEFEQEFYRIYSEYDLESTKEPKFIEISRKDETVSFISYKGFIVAEENGCFIFKMPTLEGARIVASLPENTEDDPYSLDVSFIDDKFVMPILLIEPFYRKFHKRVIVKLYYSYNDNPELLVLQGLKLCLPDDLNDLAPAKCKDIRIIYKRLESADIEYSSVKFNKGKDSHTVSVLDDAQNVVETVQLDNYVEIIFKTDSAKPELASGNSAYSNRLVLSALKSSFESGVSGLGKNQKDILVKYFDGCMKLFATNGYFAPYTTVCQSSGFGKSKLVLECGEDLPLVYGVFRADGDKSYPNLSPWIHDFYHRIINTKPQSCAILAYFLEVMNAYHRIYSQLMSLPEYENDSKRVMKEISHRFATEEGQENFFKDIKYEHKIEAFSQAEITKLEDEYVALIKEKSIEITSQVFTDKSISYPFVIVLDEASLLLEFNFEGKVNPLTAIRRALHLLSEDSRLLIVVIGTNGDVSEYNRRVNDDSLRYMARKKILPPCVLTRNWDVLRSKFDLNSLKITCENMMCKDLLLLLITFGRPMWCSIPLVSLFEFAAEKIINGSKNNNYIPFMAVWSIRAGLTINSDLKLAKTLLKSNMATAVSLSYSSDSMYIGYPSEPVLAIAARTLISTQGNIGIMFQQLLNFIQGRPIDKGQLVESIFFQILLIAVDRAVKVCNVTHPDKAFSYPQNDPEFKKLFNTTSFIFDSATNIDVAAPTSESIKGGLAALFGHYHITTVGNFLKSLFGSEKFEAIKNEIDPRMLRGLVNVSHFINLKKNFPMDETFGTSDESRIKDLGKIPAGTDDDKKKKRERFDEALLRHFFIRQAGFICPENNYGIDGGIVVLLPRDDPTATAAGHNDIFSFIGLQMKAYYKSPGSVVTKMDIKEHYARCPLHGGDGSKCPLDCTKKVSDGDYRIIIETSTALYLSAESPDIPVSGSHEDASESLVKLVVDIKNVAFNEPDDSAEPDEPELHVRKKRPRIASEKALDKIKILFQNESTSNTPILTTSMDQFEEVKLFRCEHQRCIALKSLAGLLANGFITEDLIKLIEDIVHCRNSPFHQVEKFNFRSVADSVINCQFGTYPEADPYIRTARGLEALPKVEIDFNTNFSRALNAAVESALIPPYPAQYKSLAKLK